MQPFRRIAIDCENDVRNLSLKIRTRNISKVNSETDSLYVKDFTKNINTDTTCPFTGHITFINTKIKKKVLEFNISKSIVEAKE